MVTSNLQLLTPSDGRGIILAPPFAQIPESRPSMALAEADYNGVSRVYHTKSEVFTCFPVLNQLGTAPELFLGRRWELGAVNLGLSHWSMMLKTVGTDFEKKSFFFVFSSVFEKNQMLEISISSAGWAGRHRWPSGGGAGHFPKLWVRRAGVAIEKLKILKIRSDNFKHHASV